MNFKQICDAVITSYPINIFQWAHVLQKLSKSSINMTDFYATLDIAAKFFKNRTHFNNSKRCFLNEYQMWIGKFCDYYSFAYYSFTTWNLATIRCT